MVRITIAGEIDAGKVARLMRDDKILIGYPSGIKHPGSDLDNADLAEKLHYGTEKIPWRPWLTDSLSNFKAVIKREFGASLKNVIRKGIATPEQIGATAVGCVQSFVRGGYYRSNVPNAPSTIKRKSRTGHSDVPLIDTAFMINSTTFVTKKGLHKVAQTKMKGGQWKIKAGKAE